MREAAEEMLEGSGVPELETRVLGFLTSNAATIKLSAVLDDLTRLLHLVRPLTAAQRERCCIICFIMASTTDLFRYPKHGRLAVVL